MKKLCALLLSFILITAFIAPVAQAVEFSADLAVSGAIPELYSGKEGEIKFTVKNIALFAGYDITMSLKSEDGLFTTGSIVNRIDIGTLLSQTSKEIIIPITVFGTAKTGYYQVSLTFNCQDRSGNPYTINENITIHINGEDKVDPAAPDLRISSAKLDTNSPGDKSIVNLTLGVMNSGKGRATKLNVLLTNLTSGGFSLYEDYTPRTVSELKAGGSSSVSFPLYVGSDITTGNHALNVTIEYLDQNNEKQKLETTVFVYINRPEKEPETPDDGKTSTPRIIISKYELDTDTVNAGQPFNLTFSLKNTSTSQTVKNLAVSLSSTDGVFLPVAGTSSFYISSIGPGGSYEMSIDLSPKRDSETKSYPVTIHVEYEDAKTNPYVVDQSLSIPVNQEQKLELGQINCYSMGPGSPANINFQYYNKGKAILYNTTVKVEGPFTFENGDIFVGNVSPSSSDYIDDNVIPSETGDLAGTIVMQYEDVNGNLKELRQDFQVYVDDYSQVIEPMPEDPGYVDPGMSEEPSGISPWILFAIGGGTILAIAIVIIVVVRKRKKAKEMVEDDE